MPGPIRRDFYVGELIQRTKGRVELVLGQFEIHLISPDVKAANNIGA